MQHFGLRRRCWLNLLHEIAAEEAICSRTVGLQSVLSFGMKRKSFLGYLKKTSKIVSRKHSIQDRVHALLPPLPFLANKCIDHSLRSLFVVATHF